MALIKTYTDNLHAAMLADIHRCYGLHLPEKEKVESCFWIANDYVEKLKQLIITTEFDNEEAEIDFFRNVKPTFTSQIEYFLILNEALPFVPTIKEEAIHFWEDEKKRFERFCNRNWEFIEYYKSDRHDYDRSYFLRADENWKPVILLASYDSDLRFCSTHDHFIRSYLAQQLYHDYANHQIESLYKK